MHALAQSLASLQNIRFVGFNLIPPILETCAKFYKANGTPVIAPCGKEEEKANHFHCDQRPPAII